MAAKERVLDDKQQHFWLKLNENIRQHQQRNEELGNERNQWLW